MKIDPCNGHVRRCCHKCLFYEDYKDGHGIYTGCTFNEEANAYHKHHPMKWVSATDYERDPEIKAKHDAPCFAFVDKEELKNTIRNSIVYGNQEEDPNG